MSLTYWQSMVAANLNRPTDEATLSREARKLADQGLTERDIGQALQLDPTAVRRLLTVNAAQGDSRAAA